MRDWQKSDAGVRRRLAAALPLADVPEALWAELQDRGVRDVREAVDPDELFADLVDVALSYLRAMTAQLVPAPPRRRQARAGNKLLTAEEFKRAEAVSIVIARSAESRDSVAKFRRGVLGERTLTDRDAAALLCSPAFYLLTADELHQLHITAETPATAVCKRQMTGAETWTDDVTLDLRLGKRRERRHFSIPRRHGDGQWLEVPPDLWGRATPFGHLEPLVNPGAAFDELRKTCNGLCNNLLWQPWDAMWFVLTGSPPFISPIRPGIRRWSSMAGAMPYRREVLTLEVDTWLSAKSLGRVFLAYQRALRGDRNRQLEAKAISLFQFVLGREQAGKRVRSWPKLMAEWNHAHRHQKDWQYGDFRQLRRDYMLARRRILSLQERPMSPLPAW